MNTRGWRRNCGKSWKPARIHHTEQPQRRQGLRALMPRCDRQSVELRGYLDLADKAGVQRAKVFGGDPVLQDGLAAYLVDFVIVQERPADLETSHVARAGLPDVPVAGDHGGVFLVEHRVEDRMCAAFGTNLRDDPGAAFVRS